MLERTVTFSNVINHLKSDFWYYSKTMKTFRVVLGILGILVIAFFIMTLLLPEWLHPDLAELLYMVIAVPVFTLNMWAWVHPELIEVFFLGKEKR